MRRVLKTLVLWLGKSCGLFILSRWLMRRRLLILCYHGFELDDEARFRPKLFMRPEVFRSRLALITRRRFPVLTLSEALERLDQGTLPDNTIVLTIDDGFASTLVKAAPLLKQFQMPATLYQTTYYVDKPAIFRLVVQYMFWKTKMEALDMTGLQPGASGKVSLVDASTREQACWAIIAHGEGNCGEGERLEICQRLGDRLGVDFGQIVRSRILSLLTSSEIESLPAWGIDVQLHTHRHRFPEDETQATREIEDNRAALGKVLRGPLIHFCYPSGSWSPSQFPWLESEGVVSATTCQAGFNTSATHKLALHRFLDEDGLSSIEFEAALCGFREVFRAMAGKRGGLRPEGPHVQ